MQFENVRKLDIWRFYGVKRFIGWKSRCDGFSSFQFEIWLNVKNSFQNLTRSNNSIAQSEFLSCFSGSSMENPNLGEESRECPFSKSLLIGGVCWFVGFFPAAGLMMAVMVSSFALPIDFYRSFWESNSVSLIKFNIKSYQVASTFNITFEKTIYDFYYFQFNSSLFKLFSCFRKHWTTRLPQFFWEKLN